MPKLDNDALKDSIKSTLESADGVVGVTIRNMTDHSADGRVMFESGALVPIHVKFDSERDYRFADTQWDPGYVIDSEGRVFADGKHIGYFKLNKRKPETQRHLRRSSSVRIYTDLSRFVEFDPKSPQAMADYIFENGSRG